LMSLIIKECSGFLFNLRYRSDKRFRFLNIYQQEISNAAAKEVECFEKMKRVVNKLTHQVDENKVPSELLDSSTEMDLMKRLKHIRRELDVILRVVTEQGNVIEQASELIATSRHLRASQDLHTAELAKQHIHKLEKRKKGIEALDAKAEHIFNDLENLTRRKEQQVQNWQAHFSGKQLTQSVKQAEFSGEQLAQSVKQAQFSGKLLAQSARSGKVIIVFTVVTIIFAPLSFLSAFYAVGVVGYPRDANGYMPFSFVSSRIFGIGFGIAVTVIILALTINMLARMEEKKARGTKNPPPGSSGTSTPVKEIRGFFSVKPWLTGKARQRNGPSGGENGTV